MSAKILICLNPFISHFLPMIPFMKRLKEKKHTLLLMGDISLKGAVEAEGFDFTPILSFSNDIIEDMQKKKKFSEMKELYLKLHQEVHDKLLEFEPKYILMGISRFHLYLKPALESNASIYLFSLCCGIPFFNRYSPPITTDYIPKRGFWGQIQNLKLWVARLKRKGLNVSVFKERCLYPWNCMRKMCKKKGIKQRFGIDGFFPNFPILILGTCFLEFDERENLNFLGVDIRTDSESYEPISKSKDEKLIYCSFGTMNHRYKNINEFVFQLIEVLREEPRWKLIVSLGSSIDISSITLPSNITVYKFAPQISILKQVDMVITHGGYGTVKESVNLGVPMLVLPCIYDQRGNAARVHYYQIGIRDFMLQIPRKRGKEGQSKSINKEHIKEKMNEILYNPIYKNNIDKLKENIYRQNELDEACERLFE